MPVPTWSNPRSMVLVATVMPAIWLPSAEEQLESVVHLEADLLQRSGLRIDQADAKCLLHPGR